MIFAGLLNHGWWVPSIPKNTYFLLLIAFLTVIANILLFTHLAIKNRLHGSPNGGVRASKKHLLVVLGSGGHTSEMFHMLKQAPLDPALYAYRTYVVSSGDSFSAGMAKEFEDSLQHELLDRKAQHSTKDISPIDGAADSELTSSYAIVTVPRARRVHQSFFTAPFSTLNCLWQCLRVIRGTHPDQQHPHVWTSSSPDYQVSKSGPLPAYPDIVLTNGPATAVCVIVAAKLLRLANSFCLSPQTRKSGKHANVKGERYLRTIFVESWARVTTLSLSGKLLLPIVDRFLVQWESLEGYPSWLGGKTEYVGALVG